MTDSVLQFVLRELDTHARSEDEVLYEAVENCQGVPGAVDTMRRDHVEINRLAAELSDLHGSLVIGHELSDETTRALRRVLYGLHAIVRLHFEKEEEILTPYLEHKLPAAEQERVLARLRSVAA
jgi:iron-sulfur cluster repair protein YtfE (RIC family)